MLSNQPTPSLVHHYKQFPLNDEPFNKKTQKHSPQRLDVVGNSAEFTIKTGLMELLPDECMVGIEYCFMNDYVAPPAPPAPVPSSTYIINNLYQDYDWCFVGQGEANWYQTTNNKYPFIPLPTVTTGNNNVIQIRGAGGTDVGLNSGIYIQTKQASQSVATDYTFTWRGWKFNST